MLVTKKITTFAPLKRRETRDEFGRMAEWSNAAVLKTVDLHGSGGSNPSLSASNLDCPVFKNENRIFFTHNYLAFKYIVSVFTKIFVFYKMIS